MRPALIVWFIFINAVAYLVMSEDKRRARLGRERVPERTLFLLAAVGGALGIWVGMYRKRHKTRHLSFKIGVPLLLSVNAALYAYFWL
ncbi:DUF1294 domain-containing protein [Paenibacillus sp. JCM 10914]|uniref:DUF1294 domain-containing protein n=1 Tax=Paenibacillus sp. JCM 10914 TaxID=1236974 RepID=UPI0003CC320A|nr:DUF1294 domain-containing protein [Paenibacillus sp. JCM 10914]GAE09497.1 hypothetical protein JCM10914_5859 [Paenibacillus sp. JCM 10914]